MISNYIDDDLEVRIVMYSPVIGGHLVFRFLIEVSNKSALTKDFEIRLSAWKEADFIEVKRSMVGEIPAIPPGDTKQISVLLENGESCKRVTIDEIYVGVTSRNSRTSVGLPRLNLWNVATHDLLKSLRD